MNSLVALLALICFSIQLKETVSKSRHHFCQIPEDCLFHSSFTQCVDNECIYDSQYRNVMNTTTTTTATSAEPDDMSVIWWELGIGIVAILIVIICIGLMVVALCKWNGYYSLLPGRNDKSKEENDKSEEGDSPAAVVNMESPVASSE